MVDRKVGTRRLYQVDPQAVADLRAYFDSFWDQSLAAFRDAAEQKENERWLSSSRAGVAVRQSIVVEAPPERAFDGLHRRDAARGGRWRRTRSATEPMAAAVVEPRAGGRWYERAEDGSECDWGRVARLGAAAPRRARRGSSSPDWRPDPDLHTEIEVRFTPEGDGRTRVELEHRGLEALRRAHGRDARTSSAPTAAGRGLLARFAEAAAA